MALIKCKECGNDVSTKAKACPKCGANVPKNQTALLGCLVLLLGVVGISVVGATLRKKDQTSAPASATTAPAQQPAPAAPAPSFAFTDKERTAITVLLEDDLSGFAADGDTLFGRSSEGQSYVLATADNLQKDYEKNEVAGDKKYRGKSLVLRGKVGSVDRSVGENYFLSLVGGTNMFMRPKAKMADGHTDYLAGLSKGDSVELVCVGDGMLVGSAMVTNCIPYQTWTRATIARLIDELPQRARASDKGALVMIAMAIAAASNLPETSPCWAGKSDACAKEMVSGKWWAKDADPKAIIGNRLD